MPLPALAYLVYSSWVSKIAILLRTFADVLFCSSVQSQFFSICSEVLPRHHRGTAQLVNNWMGTAGSVVGLYVGGALVSKYPVTPGQYSGWRGMFW